MAVGGKVLFDTDSFYRILFYLQTHHQSKFTFDAKKLELIEKKNNLRAPYPILPIWNEWFQAAGLIIQQVFGNYDFSPYSINSPRLIIIVKKMPGLKRINQGKYLSFN